MKLTLTTNSCVPADKEGGPPYASFYLAQALQREGCEARIVSTDRNGRDRLRVRLDAWTRVSGVPVFYAKTSPGAWMYSATYAEAAQHALQDSDACIMPGIFWNYTGLAAWRACRRFNVPYFTIPHGLLSPWAMRHKGLKKALYWRMIARRIVSGSHALLASAEQERRDGRRAGLRLPMHVVPNGGDHLHGLDLDDPHAHDATLQLTGGQRYVLFLGRIHEKKGLDILVPAFSEVARRHRDVRLVIAGTIDPAYARTFDALLGASDVRDRIVLTGNVDGPRKAAMLRYASLFALTSYSEGLPVVALEALAAGTPVILTPECNLPEIVSAAAGVEVRRDPAVVARVLGDLLGDETRRQQISVNAAALARDSFSWASVARRVLTICADVRRGTPLRPASSAARAAEPEPSQ
jgi:glycosyltransferase involved in cell wall biosynthesis